ncbi:MAG: hypothetical protein EAZ42_13355 [Verrucomicrobia bacterium]|nr:MAG: hypothetical protein EAZ42_13355 [Verrucomicrobiota bacterium]
MSPSIPGTVTLTDTATQNPALADGVLTITTGTAQDTSIYYSINFGAFASNPALFADGFAIDANLIVEMGTQFDARRAPAIMQSNIAGSIKTLHLGTSFASLTTDFESPFPTTSTNNQNAFHNYRMVVGGTAIGSSVHVFKDGKLILTSTTGNQTGANSPNMIFYFGEASLIAQGTSRWTSFSIETIPEPSSALFASLGAIALLRRKR